MVALGELIDRWLDDIAPHRASYTVQEYRRLIVKTIKPALGNTRLDRLTGRQLDDFYRRLLQRGLSNSSVHQHHSIVHAALGLASTGGSSGRTLPTGRAPRH
jgi:site-specific recombinase XerC